jgi:hypothetical protein
MRQYLILAREPFFRKRLQDGCGRQAFGLRTSAAEDAQRANQLAAL